LGFHLALPYKTPWLLLLVFSLPLTLALPYLLSGSTVRTVVLAPVFLTIALLARWSPFAQSQAGVFPLHFKSQLAILPKVYHDKLTALLASSSLSAHSPTSFQVKHFENHVADLAKAYGGNFYVAIEGGHYWPLPYYLRKYPVGYGDFPQADKAPLRLIPATDSSEPVVPGYAVSSLTLREGGDRYWVLVAKAHESVFIGK